MKTILFGSFGSLEETLNHLKSLKIKSYLVDNVACFWAIILVDAEHLESARDFIPGNLGYITCIFEDNLDDIFCLWFIHK